MKEFYSSVSPKGQVTLPIEIRKQLGLRPKDKVVIVLDKQGVRLRRAEAGVRAGFKSIPALPIALSVEEMTEIAAEENAADASRAGLKRLSDGSPRY